MTEEAVRELDKQGEILRNAIFANALLTASKENRRVIDEEHIKKASTAVRITQSSRLKWFTVVSIGLLFSFATLQLGTLATMSFGNTPALWILPSVVFIWILILSYTFKDFL